MSATVQPGGKFIGWYVTELRNGKNRLQGNRTHEKHAREALTRSTHEKHSRSTHAARTQHARLAPQTYDPHFNQLR